MGEPLGDVIVAFLAIAQALKSQPSFDRTLFDAEIKRKLENSKFDSLSKKILESVLDQLSPKKQSKNRRNPSASRRSLRRSNSSPGCAIRDES